MTDVLFEYPTPSKLLSTMLDVLRYAYAARGIRVEVSKGSDHYRRAEIMAERVGMAIRLGKLAAKDASPFAAQGQALRTLAAVFRVYPRPASMSAGGVIISGSATVAILAGFTGTLNGQRYKVLTTAAYAPGATVQIQAVVAGSAGNAVAGALLTWESASIGALASTAVVDASGLHDGYDEDDQEALRQRLLDRLTAPSVGGNWAMVVEEAEGATAAVEKAYAFCGAQGPSSVAVCCTAKGGTRQLATATLNLVRAALTAKFPGQARILVTTPTPEPVDITMAMSVPTPIGAGGLGDGWTDARPWPAEDVVVTAFDGTKITVTLASGASETPAALQSIGLWDPTATDPATGLLGAMQTYIIATATNTGGTTWDITAGGAGFPTGATWVVGSYISAGCLHLAQYASAFAAEVAKLGPGQVTDQAELLPRARREPAPEDINSTPSGLTSKLLRVVQDPAAFPEVSDLSWGIRYLAGTTTPASTPAVPLTTADPPHVFTINTLAFRKL